jgi:8-oxo-dGTP pyrophosphatase MutT (NUDIX family)
LFVVLFFFCVLGKREFRSAGGFVTELPGGSVLDDGERDAADVAIEEIQEEIGFAASKKDLIRLGARTSAPTLLPHLASAFAIRVSDEQMREFERMERENVSFGKAEDTEKTFVLVRSLRQCFEGSECCWTTLGILGALMKETL